MYVRKSSSATRAWLSQWLTCQVLFLGACLDPGAPVMFVTEYMPRGARGGWDGRSNPG